MVELKCPECGSPVEWVKLYEKNRYDGFLRCTGCGREGRLYVSKQNAVKAWNGGDMEKIRERYNKLMCEIGMDHKVSDSMSIPEMVSECKYWLDCYLDESTSAYDLKYDDNKLWRSHTGKLRRFIGRYGG